MKDFRLLNADEIDVRVSHTSKNFDKGMLLLYKDARCDMRILDETLGITGWQRTHEIINGQLFCNVSIYDDEKKCWIVKQDVGVESFSEAEKGRASDAFKRACFNLGIGRELYTAPQIWVEDISKKNTKDAWKYKNFRVKDIGYDDNRKINKLIIEEYSNYKWQEVFRYPRNGFKNQERNSNTSAMNSKKQEIEHMFSIAESAGIANTKILEKMRSDYGKARSKDLTAEEIGELISWISQESFA